MSFVDTCRFRQKRHRRGLVLRREVRVAQRHLDVGMTEEFADGVQIHATLNQPARERVPQMVQYAGMSRMSGRR